MIPRQAQQAATRLARGFPVVAITGPRQAGKTTLARDLFPQHAYVSLEDPEQRSFALEDPRGFLARFRGGVILDEVQRCPQLFSYLQGVVDERPVMGQFVLTGSQQFGLQSAISQSLAGRVGLLQLLPFSMAELAQAGRLPEDLDTLLLTGGYPPLYDRDLSPDLWFPSYVATYVERDVRQMLAVRDLDRFQRFVRLCAARSGQLLNLSSLASDAGISHVTAREWLTVLEASYLVLRLPPYHSNFGKRLVKTPKLYFLDVALAAWLLGIRDRDAISIHAQRGALFETLVVSEFVKMRFHAAQPIDLYFWRDNVGLEVDLLFEIGNTLQAIECKSGSTFASDWLVSLNRWQSLTSSTSRAPWIVYGGTDSYQRQGAQVLSWRDLPSACPDLG
jgi:predicted AAA+ superfamily ATPase